MSNNALYVLDTFGLIFRAYYAHIRNPLRFNGKNTSAIYGFFSTLFSFINTYKPQYLISALDAPGTTFRHTLYESYKANRDATPEDLIVQIQDIITMLKTLGIPLLIQEGYEADDIIATVCSHFQQERTCYIVSADKDLLQLVNDNVQQLKPETSGEFHVYNRDEVHEKWKVYPEQIVDLLSMVGDSADNVPGVRGIGKVGAAHLLQEYGSLKNIYHHIASVKEKYAKLLVEGRESAEISSELITLRANVPLHFEDIDTFSLNTIHFGAAREAFQNNGIRRLLEENISRLQEVGYQVHDTEVATQQRASQAEVSPSDASQDSVSPAVRYTCVLDEKQLHELVAEVKRACVFAFDTETDSLVDMRARAVGFSISVQAGSGYYIPLVAPETTVLPEDTVKQALGDILGDHSLKMICQNAKYDIHVLRNWGVDPVNLYFDTMIAAWLLDTDAHSYGMDKLAEKYLTYTPQSYSSIMKEHGVSYFAEVPLQTAVHYAAEDADITYRLYQVFEAQLREHALDTIFFTLEMPLIMTLVNMEQQGIYLDQQRLAEQETQLAQSVDTIKKQIYTMCGHEFNINSPQQLQTVLFQERKLVPLNKIKSGYSTDNTVLQQLQKQDPLPGLILDYRMLNKLKTSYLAVLPKLIHPTTNRIHTSYLQTGAATGRLASKDPNLQNIPIKTEEGRRIRNAFYAADDALFVSADYSQIELIVLAHFSQDEALLNAFKTGKDIHTQTAAMIFGAEPADVTSEQRRIAKSINFGVIYGMSAFRLANEIDISRADASVFIKTYFERYRSVQEFITHTIMLARQQGYVSTLLGRKRFVASIQSKNYNLRAMGERIALNTIIQGSAADIMKLAMMAVEKRLKNDMLPAHLVLQIHDELVVECSARYAERVQTCLAEEMTNCIALTLPLQVHTTVGRSWGEL